jgi:hypothetical protein
MLYHSKRTLAYCPLGSQRLISVFGLHRGSANQCICKPSGYENTSEKYVKLTMAVFDEFGSPNVAVSAQIRHVRPRTYLQRPGHDPHIQTLSLGRKVNDSIGMRMLVLEYATHNVMSVNIEISEWNAPAWDFLNLISFPLLSVHHGAALLVTRV